MYVNEYDSRSLGFNMLKLIKFDIVVRLALLGLAWPDEAREEKKSTLRREKQKLNNKFCSKFTLKD